jgi:hypothetical protein
MAGTKITELTPGQWQMVHQRRTEWLGSGLSTAPADRPAAEQAITGMYRLIKEKPPQYFWADSPAGALMATAVLSKKHPTLVPQLDSSLRASLRHSLDSSLAGSLDSSFYVRLRDSLDSSLAGSLGTAVAGVVHDSLYGGVSGPARDQYACFWGQHEWWLAWYLVPCELGIASYRPDHIALLQLWARLANSAGWWWPGKKLCIVSDRPALVHTETWDASRGTVRLHNSTGPAIAYRDGLKEYAWHGRRVPAWVIEEPTAERIAAESNAEVRQCAIEALG